ncbi:MAG TPA: hypothetical protein VNW97_16025 [Candidatus Saccharimonadales bacterium]|jgi:hypothetical protein|nr:hypothetical protein [Candidatus Saccharimonadales bacterium]
MECPNCKCSNPEGKKFCNDCGVQLNPSQYVSIPDLNRQIRAAIKEELRDQKVVEVEITELVISRIAGWARLLGYFAGVPLTILVLVLGGFGIKKYTDLWSLANAAEQKVKPVVDQAQNQANDLSEKTKRLKDEGDKVEKQLSELEPQIAAIKASSEKLSTLESTVNTRFSVLQKTLDQKVAGLENQVVEIKRAIVPGKERWPVKTGSDDDASQVSETPIVTTVEEMVKLLPPANLALFQNSRVHPVELNVYTIVASIARYKLEADGDYHLVLQGRSGATMVAEIPDADPIFVPSSSRWAKQIAIVRKQFEEKLKLGQDTKIANVRVKVTGIGYFDLRHGQMGMSANGIELHPVIAIDFLE